MTDPSHREESPRASEKGPAGTSSDPDGAARLADDGTGKDSANGPAPESESEKLTAEEQMARYENELKETDWGHQPC